MLVCHIGFLFLSFSVSSIPVLVPSVTSTPVFPFCSIPRFHSTVSHTRANQFRDSLFCSDSIANTESSNTRCQHPANETPQRGNPRRELHKIPARRPRQVRSAPRTSFNQGVVHQHAQISHQPALEPPSHGPPVGQYDRRGRRRR